MALFPTAEADPLIVPTRAKKIHDVSGAGDTVIAAFTLALAAGAIDLALDQLRRSRNPKKAMLVISNRFSGLGPATVEHVQGSGCTLLTLGFSNTASILISLGGDEISRKQLMRESGGRPFSAETSDITGVCRAIASSLKNYYSLGYQTEVKPGDRRARRLEVSVTGRKYTINARRSFIPE